MAVSSMILYPCYNKCAALYMQIASRPRHKYLYSTQHVSLSSTIMSTVLSHKAQRPLAANDHQPNEQAQSTMLMGKNTL
jgi:hypothetical protein